ncbi:MULTISPECIES: hypothetical protein [Natrialbaceae]|uniref:hypothetical protein n=1 Tax=Natrialbaceae TaxID=1644061 RepID=UPI00207D6276|nr:hypothetical protein [Natronococcus sp. CG52]
MIPSGNASISSLRVLDYLEWPSLFARSGTGTALDHLARDSTQRRRSASGLASTHRLERVGARLYRRYRRLRDQYR